jgi:hypothetical protein
VLADVMVNMHRKRIVVLMQDERPKEIDEWDGPKIEVDMRHPDLLDTFRRQEKGFKRIPSLVNFGD